MIKVLFLLLGLFSIFIPLYFLSENKKNIKFGYIIQLVIIEIILGYFLLHTNVGMNSIQCISSVFDSLLAYSEAGSNFVFSGMLNPGEFSFFLSVLMPIVLISALIGILQYIGLLQLIIRSIGFLLSKINGMGQIESFNAISSLIIGQSENFITYKNILPKISDRRMYTMATTAMSTVSLSIIGSYMRLIPAKYIVVSLLLNMFSSFVILHIVNPYNQTEEIDFDEISSSLSKKNQVFFEMLSEYILDGFKVAIIVGAMLIGFISLISMLNNFSLQLLSISFQDLLGYIMYPMAWILHIDKETLAASSIMATKIVSNEFVAMTYLKHQLPLFSSHTIGVISIFLVSFSNFSSIGIIIGAVHSLNRKKSNFIAKYSFKILFNAIMVSFLSSVVGSFII